MLIERIVKTVDKPLRTALLTALISASGGGLPSSVGGGISKSVRVAEAAGLELDEKPLVSEEQEEPNMAAARKLVEAVAAKNLEQFRQLINGDSPAWKRGDVLWSTSVRSRDEMVQLFKKALDRGKPDCLGIVQTAPFSVRNRKWLGVVFQGLSALEDKDLSGSTIFGFWVDAASLRWGIDYVEELTRAQLAQIKKEGPKPCPGAAVAPAAPKPEVKPPPKAESPKDLPKGKIVYAAKEKDGPDATYTSNADGSDKKVLVNNLGHDRRYMAILPNDRVAYSEWKDGKANIVVLDTQTGKEQELTTSQDKPANTIDICPSPDDANSVIFTRSGFRQQGIVNEILRAYFDGRKPEALKPGSKEDFCPTVSPDRKYVAATLVDPSAGFSEPQGVAVYEYQGYGQDQAKLIARLAGIRLLGWMPTSQEVLLTKKGPNSESLYIVSVDGKQARLITDIDVQEAASSPDGNWILVSASGEGRGPTDLWLFSAQGGSGIRITNTPYSETLPQWLPEGKPEPKPEPRPRPEPVITVVPELEVEPLPGTSIFLIPGMLTPIERGWEVGGRFSPLRKRIASETDLRIGFSRIFISGLTGGYFEHGLWIPNDQTCENTLQSLEISSRNEVEMIVGFLKHRPNDKLIIIAHSLGGPVMLHALEIIRNREPEVDLSKVVLITLNSPNQGIDKPIISQIGQILPKDLPEDCYMDFGDFRTPPPQVLDYPVTRELRAMWDNHDKRREELADLMTWFRVQGGRATAGGNYQDCVIAWEPCGETFPGNWIWDIILPPILRFIVKDPYFWLLPEVLYTQTIPGANKNIMQALGKTPNWGHTPYLIPGQGMDMLIEWIREEVRRGRRLLKVA